MDNKAVILILVGLLIIGGYFAWRGNHKETPDTTMGNLSQSAGNSATSLTTTSTSTPAQATTTEVSVSATSTQGSKTREITVTGSNFAFVPATIAVNNGDMVKIHFVNSAGFHDFKLDEFNVSIARVQGGQSSDVSFIADKTGSFEYYCSVGTHRQMGMKGTLIVK